MIQRDFQDPNEHIGLTASFLCPWLFSLLTWAHAIWGKNLGIQTYSWVPASLYRPLHNSLGLNESGFPPSSIWQSILLSYHVYPPRQENYMGWVVQDWPYHVEKERGVESGTNWKNAISPMLSPLSLNSHCKYAESCRPLHCPPSSQGKWQPRAQQAKAWYSERQKGHAHEYFPKLFPLPYMSTLFDEGI